jgi:hypothetical protein
MEQVLVIPPSPLKLQVGYRAICPCGAIVLLISRHPLMHISTWVELSSPLQSVMHAL